MVDENYSPTHVGYLLVNHHFLRSLTFENAKKKTPLRGVQNMEGITNKRRLLLHIMYHISYKKTTKKERVTSLFINQNTELTSLSYDHHSVLIV